jgi:hypothetical protein
MNNLVIGLDKEFCKKSFIINRIKKYLNYNIVGDYLRKTDCKYFYIFFNVNNIFYNGESTKSNIKYIRPFSFLKHSISYKKGNMLYYPYIAEFYLSFGKNLLKYRNRLDPSPFKNKFLCMISSNKNKIKKSEGLITALGGLTLYGKYGLETISSTEADAYDYVHDSAIKTHSMHSASFIAENQLDFGYVTEKILLCLYGNSVPIYLGTDISNIIKSDYYISYYHYFTLTEVEKKLLIESKYQNILKADNFFTEDFNKYLDFIKYDFLVKSNFSDAKKISQMYRDKFVIYNE